MSLVLYITLFYASPPSYITLLPYSYCPHLPVANSMEGLISRSLRKGRGSLTSSSCFTGKAPAASQKRASQGSSSWRTKCQKTKPNKAPAEPLTYYKVESNSDLKPIPKQASIQTRIEIHSQWYRRSDKVI